MNYRQKSSVVAKIAAIGTLAIAILTPASVSTAENYPTQPSFNPETRLQYKVTIGSQLNEKPVKISIKRRMPSFEEE